MSENPYAEGGTTQPRASWFCHSCSSSLDNILHVPNPTCPRCQSEFVEQIEANNDDPRRFDPVPEGFQQFQGQTGGGGMFHALTQMLGMMANRGTDPQNQQQQPASSLNQPGYSRTMRYPGGQVTFHLGHGAMPPEMMGHPMHPRSQQQHQPQPNSPSQNPPSNNPNQPPQMPRHGQPVPIQNLAEFLHQAFGPNDEQDQPQPQPTGEPTGRERPPGTGDGNPLAALFSMMTGMDDPNGMYMPFGMGGGQMGDYVFSQTALDNIMTQLMDQAQGRFGPQPAPQDVIDKLPKFKMTDDLIKEETIQDCAVCKDDFVADDEVMKLPCNHVYHADCITPWLQQSGTCPVCRYALVEQPQSLQPPTAPQGGPPNPNDPSSSSGGPAGSSGSAPAASPSLPHSPPIDGGSTMPGSFRWLFGGGPPQASSASGTFSMNLGPAMFFTSRPAFRPDSPAGVRRQRSDNPTMSTEYSNARRRMEAEVQAGDDDDEMPPLQRISASPPADKLPPQDDVD